MINLQKFCDPEIEKISNPFSDREWLYATNGHIMIRIPAPPYYKNKGSKEAPILQSSAMFALADERDGCRWIDLPDYIPAKEMETCEKCDGKSVECDSCGNERTWEKAVAVRVDYDSWGRYPIWLSSVYLRLIKEELPKPELGLFKESAGKDGELVRVNGFVPVRIRFDGGIGLLMPIRNQTKGE